MYVFGGSKCTQGSMLKIQQMFFPFISFHKEVQEKKCDKTQLKVANN